MKSLALFYLMLAIAAAAQWRCLKVLDHSTFRYF